MITVSPNPDLQAVLNRMPNLSDSGFRVWESFDDDRATLAQRGGEFDKVREWIWRNFNAIRTMNHRHTSYGLKHLVENDLGFHISNGLFIAAMAGAGYRVDVIGHNARFNVSERSVAALVQQSHNQ